MPRIERYVAQGRIEPNDRATSAWEQAGRRIGPFYNQMAQGVRELADQTARLNNANKFFLELKESGGHAAAGRGSARDALDFGRPFDSGYVPPQTLEEQGYTDYLGNRKVFNLPAHREIGHGASIAGDIAQILAGDTTTPQPGETDIDAETGLPINPAQRRARQPGAGRGEDIIPATMTPEEQEAYDKRHTPGSIGPTEEQKPFSDQQYFAPDGGVPGWTNGQPIPPGAPKSKFQDMTPLAPGTEMNPQPTGTIEQPGQPPQMPGGIQGWGPLGNREVPTIGSQIWGAAQSIGQYLTTPTEGWTPAGEEGQEE